MQLAAYSHQCEIVHMNIFVCNENLSGGNCFTMKGVHSFVTVTGTQFPLSNRYATMDLLEHLARCLIRRYLLQELRSPNKSNNWLRSYVIKQT